MKNKKTAKAKQIWQTFLLGAIFISLTLFFCLDLSAQETETDVVIDDFHIKDTALPPATKKSAVHLNLGIKARSLISKEREESSLLESGLIVTHVTDDSPADNAGLQKDDIILFENNNLVQGTQSLRESMKKISVGNEAYLTVINEEGLKEVCLHPEYFDSSSKDISLGIKVKKGPVKGIASLGLLVTAVKKNTPASHSGIAQGDIILFLDGKPITSLTDVRSILSWKKPGDSLRVSVLRKKTRSDFMIFFESKKEEYKESQKRKPVANEKNKGSNEIKPEASPVTIKSTEKVSKSNTPGKRLPSIHVGANGKNSYHNTSNSP